MNKKFKAIVAGTMAAATVATTAVALTASAAQEYGTADIYDNRIYISSGSLTRYSKRIISPTINYSELTKSDDVILYKDVPEDINLKEGDKVLTIDFSKVGVDDEDQAEAMKKTQYRYLSNLYLMKDEKALMYYDDYVQGNYPLMVVNGCYFLEKDIKVGSNAVFNYNFNITSATYSQLNGSNDKLTIYYEIKDGLILPSFTGVISGKVNGVNSSYKANASCHYFYTDNGQKTTGQLTFTVANNKRGGSFDLTINGVKVGKVTLPKSVIAGQRTVSVTNY